LAPVRLARDKKGALRTGKVIAFLDESGVSLRPSVRRTWAPRGRTPTQKECFNWKRLSMVSALAWQPGTARIRLFLSIRLASIKAGDVIAFLRSLRRHVRSPIALIWDRLPAHRAKPVRDHIRRQRHWLTVHWLPPYAPELNPVEDVWANLDAHELANFAPDDLGPIVRQIRRGARRIRRRTELAWGFLRHPKLVKPDEIPNLCKAQ
jgi:transposase